MSSKAVPAAHCASGLYGFGATRHAWYIGIPSVHEAFKSVSLANQWIEEPVFADDLEGCARTANAIVMPIQIDEDFHGPAEMRASRPD